MTRCIPNLFEPFHLVGGYDRAEDLREGCLFRLVALLLHRQEEQTARVTLQGSSQCQDAVERQLCGAFLQHRHEVRLLETGFPLDIDLAFGFHLERALRDEDREFGVCVGSFHVCFLQEHAAKCFTLFITRRLSGLRKTHLDQ